jgi:hypothetical protein
MARYLVKLRRERRENAKPTLDVVRQFPDVSVTQVHSDDMVTVEATDAAAQKLKDGIGADYYVEPEIHRSLN